MYNTNQRNNTYKSLLKYKQSRSSSTHSLCHLHIQLSLNSGCFLPTSQDSTMKNSAKHDLQIKLINLKWIYERERICRPGRFDSSRQTHNYEESWNLPDGFFLLHPLKFTRRGDTMELEQKIGSKKSTKKYIILESLQRQHSTRRSTPPKR